jgi:CubicO group peptidase (beta-lactamase class C family)
MMAGSTRWLDAESLRDESELQERLAKALQGEPHSAVIAVTNRNGCFFASHPTEPEAGRRRRIRIGCLAKVFTATLAAAAAEEGSLHFEQDAGELRDSSGTRIFRALRGPSVSHLLSHTHGLDVRDTWNVPRQADGRIDLEALGQACASTRRLGEPGEVYSYGGIGAWLVGGLLEHVHRCCYRDLLQAFVSSLDRGRGMSGLSGEVPADACPANGGSVEISTSALIDLIRLHLGYDLGNPSLQGMVASLSRMRSRHFPVRGWSNERAVTPGWKFYGDGWYGHGAQLEDWSTTIRMNPEKRAGWAITSDSTRQFVLHTRLFGPGMPDIRYMSVPQVLKPDRVDPGDLEACVGAYESAVHAFVVTRGDGPTLKAHVRSRLQHGGTCEREITLLPAGPRLFLVKSPASDVLPIADFIGEGSFVPEYLWNGRQMFRRASPVPSTDSAVQELPCRWSLSSPGARLPRP